MKVWKQDDFACEEEGAKEMPGASLRHWCGVQKAVP